MPKKRNKKQWILNVALNRWGLNKKTKVGPVSVWIRQCAPKSMEEWRQCYFEKCKQHFHQREPKEYLEELGKTLYEKIKNVVLQDIKSVSLEDCVKYIEDLVIKKTFEGYRREIETVRGLLEKELGISIQPAPDEWDRGYNVDYYIEISGKCIGIQIKPLSYKHAPESHKWIESQRKTHEEFQKKYGGKVFTVFSSGEKGEKKLHNPEVIEEIRGEIERLNSSLNFNS
ncbi:MjaI family restriction endonuclease [Pseudothermotoga sp.]